MAINTNEASLICNDVQVLNSTQAESMGTTNLTLDTVFSEAPVCTGGSPDSAGSWLWIQPVFEQKIVTITACVTDPDVSSLSISIYSDLVIQSEDYSSRPVQSTCLDLTCIEPLDEALPAPEEGEMCGQEGALVNFKGASVSVEVHPFYNYFAFVQYPGIATPGSIQNVYLRIGFPDTAIVPANDIIGKAEWQGIVHGQVSIEGTLQGASIDAVPSCSSVDQELVIQRGVWYRAEPNSNAPTIPVSVCGEDDSSSPLVTVYAKEEDGTLTCMTTTEACQVDFTILAFKEYTFFVYANGEASMGDFTLKIGAEKSVAGDTLAVTAGLFFSLLGAGMMFM